jgi:hypothetical protein
MLIIRRLNCIDAASGIVTLSKWTSGAQVERELLCSSLSTARVLFVVCTTNSTHAISRHAAISPYNIQRRNFTERSILWNNQQMRQCAVKFISLQVHSTCFGRHTRPSSGVKFQQYQQPLVQFVVGPRSSQLLPHSLLNVLTEV